MPTMYVRHSSSPSRPETAEERERRLAREREEQQREQRRQEAKQRAHQLFLRVKKHQTVFALTSAATIFARA